MKDKIKSTIGHMLNSEAQQLVDDKNIGDRKCLRLVLVIGCLVTIALAIVLAFQTYPIYMVQIITMTLFTVMLSFSPVVWRNFKENHQMLVEVDYWNSVMKRLSKSPHYTAVANMIDDENVELSLSFKRLTEVFDAILDKDEKECRDSYYEDHTDGPPLIG